VPITKPLLIALFSFLLTAPHARAGLGPENLLLIINSASPNSLAVANQYIDARHIPANNIVYLDLPPQFIESIDVDNFRKLILEPIVEQIKARKLNGQIDCIAYSADFPHAVQLKTDIGGRKLQQPFTPVASINGLTYLYSAVLQKDLGYLMLNANRYAPPVHRFAATQPLKMVPARGFKRTTGWEMDGTPMPNRPDRGYLLSTVIGITAGRGNTVTEITQMIRRSAAADGTAPKGTIYYLVNNDVRSKARQWGFRPAVQQLAALNVNAEIIQGAIPINKQDVAGAMVGIADFDWTKSGSKILPGAICEHLTSWGGVMTANGSQTPLSAFIRAGASGASGTVTEPYAIQEKFPSPFIHVYYATGCTLAESFYQSVSGPYQLLIVGDPLCKPWGKIPDLSLGIENQAKLKGSITLKPQCKTENFPVAKFDLYIDGLWHDKADPKKEISLDTTKLADGYHELRLVAQASDPIESQGERIVPVTVDNQGHRVVIKPTQTQPNQPTLVAAAMAGAKRLILTQNGREIASAEGEVKAFPLDPAKTGTGPVILQAIGIIDANGTETRIPSEPVRIEVNQK
jgi:uncharacterized protein (TIGR03790 family)